MNFQENARRIREEVAGAPGGSAVATGKKDLVLLPSHLSLTIHESIGHSTELDRCAGLRGEFRGHEFHHADKLGKLRIGSEIWSTSTATAR